MSAILKQAATAREQLAPPQTADVVSSSDGKRRRTSIRQLRLQLDLTQAEMAARMGMNRSTYNELENGRNRITLNLAKRVSSETHQTVGEVLAEYEALGGGE